MSWADESDLLVGDLETGSINRSEYLALALREMETQLGRVYQLPLPANLPAYQKGTLKTVQAKIASGRLLMAEASGDEDLHAYGNSLVEQAFQELGLIGGSYHLDGAVQVGSAGEDRSPSISSPDAVSPFETYASFAHGGSTGFVDWT